MMVLERIWFAKIQRSKSGHKNRQRYPEGHHFFNDDGYDVARQIIIEILILGHVFQFMELLEIIFGFAIPTDKTGSTDGRSQSLSYQTIF